MFPQPSPNNTEAKMLMLSDIIYGAAVVILGVLLAFSMKCWQISVSALLAASYFLAEAISIYSKNKKGRYVSIPAMAIDVNSASAFIGYTQIWRFKMIDAYGQIIEFTPDLYVSEKRSSHIYNAKKKMAQPLYIPNYTYTLLYCLPHDDDVPNENNFVKAFPLESMLSDSMASEEANQEVYSDLETDNEADKPTEISDKPKIQKYQPPVVTVVKGGKTKK